MSPIHIPRNWIIEKIFQPVSDWFMDRFTISNYQLAGAFLFLMAFGLFAAPRTDLMGTAGTVLNILFGGAAFAYACGLVTIVDKHARRQAMCGTPLAPFGITNVYTQALFIIGWFWSLPFLFFQIRYAGYPESMDALTILIGITTLIVSSCFLECVLKPPKRQEAKKRKSIFASSPSS